MKTKQSHTFSVGLSVSEQSGFLELDLSYGDITKEELQELFRSYRLKKKFFRMNDGSFIDLAEAQEIGEMVSILNTLNVSSKEMEDRSTFKLAKGLALYLDDLFNEKTIQVQKNEQFYQLIDVILNIGKQKYKLPKNIHAQLRPYQETGFTFFLIALIVSRAITLAPKLA